MSEAPPQSITARPRHEAAPPRLSAELLALPVAVLLLDADAMILHANAAATALLDLPALRPGRMTPFTRLAAEPRHFADLTDALARVGSAGEALRVGPVSLRTARARVVVADLRLVEHDAAARHTLVVVVDRSGWADAEARLQTRQAQLQARERHVDWLQTAAQMGGAMVVLCDAAQRVEWVNAAFEQGTGWTADELRGRRLGVLHGSATAPEAVATMREALSAGHGVDSLQVLNYRRDGRPYWAEVSVRPMRDASGRVEGYVGVSLNIDARKRAEIELAEREGLLRGVFDAAPDAALVVRRDGVVAEANQRARHLLGLHGAESLPLLPLRESVAAEDRAAFDVGFQRALFGNTQAVDLATRSGIACSAKLWPLWRRAETHAVLVVLVDQTQTRAAEARRRVVEATAAANQLRSEFLSRVSHELRTPLNAILGFAQLLGTGTRTHRAEMVQHIMQAGAHLLALIDDVLDLSSAASGELRVTLADQPLAPLLDEVVTLQRHSADAAHVVVEVDPGPPGLAVRADPLRLRQVLTNLVSNAVKYNVPGGRVRIAAALHQGDRVEISVEDSGIGMTPEQQQALFQPFNRLGAERRRIGGTGIGLVVTQSLVKAMGGHLRVSSSAGQGSIFAFTLAAAPTVIDAARIALPPAPPRLPLSVAERAPSAWAEELPTTIAAPLDLGDDGAAQPGRARQVLYIEDDPTNGLLVAAALRSLPGLRLRIAETIGDGVRAFAEEAADLVLLDMHLPDGHGLQALDQLRRLPNWARPPVVALSADADRRHVADALAAGVGEYLTKPIVVKALLDTLSRTLALEVQAARAH